MSRFLHAILALGVLIGMGFAARYVCTEWASATVKQAQANGIKESEKWRSVKTDFSDVQFKPQLNSVPKVNIQRPPNPRPKNNIIRN